MRREEKEIKVEDSIYQQIKGIDIEYLYTVPVPTTDKSKNSAFKLDKQAKIDYFRSGGKVRYYEPGATRHNINNPAMEYTPEEFKQYI